MTVAAGCQAIETAIASLGKDVFAYEARSRGAADYQALHDELRAAGLI